LCNEIEAKAEKQSKQELRSEKGMLDSLFTGGIGLVTGASCRCPRCSNNCSVSKEIRKT